MEKRQSLESLHPNSGAMLIKFTSILGLWLSASCCSHCLVFPLTSSWFVSSRISSKLKVITIIQMRMIILSKTIVTRVVGIWLQTSMDDLLRPCDATSCASLFEPTLQTVQDEKYMNLYDIHMFIYKIGECYVRHCASFL